MAQQPKVTTAKLGNQTYTVFYRPPDVGEAERLLNGESWEKALQDRGINRLAVFIYAGLRATNPRFQPQDGMRLVSEAVNGGMSYLDLWRVVTNGLREGGFLRTEEDGAPVQLPPDAAAGDGVPSAYSVPDRS